jgi:hypothetical protein
MMRAYILIISMICDVQFFILDEYLSQMFNHIALTYVNKNAQILVSLKEIFHLADLALVKCAKLAHVQNYVLTGRVMREYNQR